VLKIAAAALVCAAAVWWWPRQPDPLPGFPHLFVWAWERPEDLRFLDPHTAGIAFLERTIFLDAGTVSVRPRFQPLRHRPDAVLMAVARVEPRRLPLPSPAAAAESIAEASRGPGVRALQVDFDATLSQRAFYRAVLTDLRRRMPAQMPLSMTALASWCQSDNWITGLPTVEAVPMLFRMGPGQHAAHSFRPELCRSSVGVSRDELLAAPPSAARLYLFNPRPWSPADFDSAIREVHRWH
jgi:hypothetical protein